jgi:hypothetical protein
VLNVCFSKAILVLIPRGHLASFVTMLRKWLKYCTFFGCFCSIIRVFYIMDVHEVGGGRGDWMELAQDRDRWRALMSTVKNLRVPYAGNFLVSCENWSASQEGLCSME